MTKEEFELKMKNKFPNESYEIIEYGLTSTSRSTIKCLDCEKVFSVVTSELFRARRKYVCGKCHAAPRKDT